MQDFGPQAAEYSKRLPPILSRFVKSFDDPNNPDIRRFWNEIVTDGGGRKGCVGEYMITGWINGFHCWNPSGAMLYHDRGTTSNERGTGAVSLDGVAYGSRIIFDFPDEYPTTLVRAPDYYHPNCSLDYGVLVAGMMGKSISKGAPEGYAMALRKASLGLPSNFTTDQHSTLQPFSRWIFLAKGGYVSGAGKTCK
jgi:hypothetical protein